MAQRSDTRILIVDDTKLGRLSVRKILDRFGLDQITECGNGEEALELFRKEEFDLVLMDILMPGIGGLETLRKMKEAGYGARTLMISADIQETTRDKCMEAGAAGFINKPVSEKKLKPALEELEII